MKPPERLSDFDLALLQQEFEPAPPPPSGNGSKPGKPGLPDPYDMACKQAEDAIERGRVDLSNAPHWRWPTLDERLGRMMPGQLVIVGALSGNGKTSFMLSQMDWMEAEGIGTLYVPLELNPEDLRRQWAAWRLHMDWQHVARNEWDQLPDGSRELHEMEMARLAQSRHIQFPPERRIDIPDLARWVAWGVEHFQARCIIIDHFHRMDFGGNTNTYRIQVSDAARALKDMAREFKITIVATAQLNRSSPPSLLDRYVPPSIDRLKESSALAEEADVVLMLSRRLRKGSHSKADIDAVRSGHKSERDFAEPDVMAVTCRKHRLSDAAAGDRSTMLRVVGGHVLESRTD